MKLIKILAIFIIIMPLNIAEGKSNLINNALDTLDNILSKQQSVIYERMKANDSLKTLLIDKKTEGNRQVADIYMKIGDGYKGLNNDSAIYYYRKLLNEAQLNNDDEIKRYVIPKLGERLAKATRFRYAFETLDTINPYNWTVPEKINYYGCLSHILIDAINYSNFTSKTEYKEKALQSLDSLLVLVDNPAAINLLLAQKFFLTDEPTMALGELNESFKDRDPFSPSYATAANMLANYYKEKAGHEDEYLYYLILSAISDARNANCEAVSLIKVGEELMKRGDLDRSFNYLAMAGEMVAKSNTHIYEIEMTPSLSQFVHLFKKKETKTRTIYLSIVIVLTIILLLLALVYLITRKKLKKERTHSTELSKSLLTRDLYISQLLNLCGVYVEGLEEYNRMVGRKLKVNQVQDLYKMIDSGKILQDQTERFFEVFDDAVLKIFPNFISEINSIFQPDKQISLLPGDRLTPELRILAFMRLGVFDSNRLSKFLGLSLNTIYTYRNRMKSRAKNREKFEDEIASLGILH